jgi:hypothetical protein
MSLSTFKRHFIVEYNEAPGNGCKISVFKEQRDSKGRSIKSFRYLSRHGLQQSSNFSIAFKNKFGKVQKFIETKTNVIILKQISCALWHIRIIVNR